MKIKTNTTPKNPLEDKNFWKRFMEEFKKETGRGQKQKNFSQRIIVRDIVCTQEDIGEPFHTRQPKSTKKTKR